MYWAGIHNDVLEQTDLSAVNNVVPSPPHTCPLCRSHASPLLVLPNRGSGRSEVLQEQCVQIMRGSVGNVTLLWRCGSSTMHGEGKGLQV